MSSGYFWLFWNALKRIIACTALVAIPGCLVLWWIAPDYRIYTTLAAIGCGGIVLKALVDLVDDSEYAENPVDDHLQELLPGRDLTKLHVCREVFPEFRFVDLYQAATRFTARFQVVTIIESKHSEDLGAILNSKF